MKQLDPVEFGKLAMCFAPKSAAIIGASTDPMKFGGRALKFCLERGYAGRLYPVNARNDVVQGVRAYRSVSELPESPDVAVIAVPAAQVRDNLAEAGRKGCKVAVVYGARFAESGDKGLARQNELLEIARAHRMRMIGPNCMGVISLASGFVASFTSAPEHHEGRGWPDPGSVSVASQSGAVGIQMLAQLRDRGVGIANWISTGNQADIDVADAIAFYAGDEETRAIAVYMEDASRGLKLCQALELARRAGKHVAVLKVGTTPLGGLAAAGHTAATYQEDRVVDDVLSQYGALRATTINELIDLVAACNAGAMPASGDVAAVSVSGGGAVMISDAAVKGGLTLPEFPRAEISKLKAVNPFVNDRNPIDISAPSMSNMEITGGHLKWGVERGASAMLGYISHVPLVPRTRAAIMPHLKGLREGCPDQFVAIAGNFRPEDRKELVRRGIAVFDDPAVAANSVAKLVKAGQKHSDPAIAPHPPSAESRDIRDALRKARIKLVDERRTDNVDAALDLLGQGGDIVLKLNAPGLRHRTEIGGVETSLECEDAVRRAHARLVERREANLEEFPGLHIVAAQMIRGIEVLLGVRQDPYFGPLLALGTGGVNCELVDDITYSKTPISAERAEEMIASTKVSRLLDGWRGAPPADCKALASTMATLSRLAAGMPSFEINPLIITADGAVGVDLLVEENGNNS
ncbi:MAG: acetate--CoA ligase family protein [Albidovulum sp.]|nr:acetate--CoA ligase family protein [Albidovulum sp.]